MKDPCDVVIRERETGLGPLSEFVRVEGVDGFVKSGETPGGRVSRAWWVPSSTGDERLFYRSSPPADFPDSARRRDYPLMKRAQPQLTNGFIPILPTRLKQKTTPVA